MISSSLLIKYADVKRSLLVLLLLGLAVNVSAKNRQDDAYDKWYNYISANLVSSDIKRALHLSDSLLVEAKTPHQRLKSHMLLAIVHSHKGDLPKALSSALKTYELARKIEDFEWLVRSSGFLSTMFRNIGLYDLGDSYLQRARNHVHRLEKQPGYKLTLANIYHEEAFYLETKAEYELALKPLRAANALLKKIELNPRSILICATNFQLQAVCYLGMGDFKQAEKYLDRSLKIIQPYESLLKAYIYRAYATLWMEQKDFSKAIPYLEKAESYIKGSDNAELKSLVYKSYMQYYKGINNSEKFMSYSDLYVNVIRKRDEIGKTVSNQLIKELEKSSNEKEINLTIIYVISLSALILVVYLVIFFRKKLRYSSEENVVKKNAVIDSKEFPMLKETEIRLLDALVQFEANKEFLNKDLSIALLATRLNTNIKYLSLVINKHKKLDFNNYINELRIRYIQHELKTNPTLLSFKLSYISGLAGFSSHSKFAAVFKNHTGMSPSNYILQLKKAE